MARVIVFDVNETLLDLSGLDEHFVHTFGDPAARREWFTQVIQSALVSTLLGPYADFGACAAAALEMTAARREVLLADDERDAILTGLRRLHPHPDVHESLQRLRSVGLRLATLTNSTQEVAEAQLQHAGIRHYFEQALSADSVHRLKPAPEPYRMAAERLGVSISEIRLVACHAWDIAGALHAGCAAAFVARPGMVFDPLVDRPDIVGVNLRDAAEQIVHVEHSGGTPQPRSRP